MTGCSEFESFVGGDGNDDVDWSDATANVDMRGNAGDDTLTGGADILYGNAGTNHMTGGDGDDSIRGNGTDYAHFSEAPEAPRYSVRDTGSYIVVTDITGNDGMDIVRHSHTPQW